MRLSLVVMQGTGQGKEIPISKTEFTIGRDAGCNLRPASQHVSKRHCMLRVRGEQVFLEDFKSTNGTFVNDQPVQGEREVHDGDRVKVGPLDFVIKLEGAQTDKPTQVEKETQVPAKAAAPAPKAPPAPAKAPIKPAAGSKPNAQPKPAPAPAARDAKAVEALDEDTIGSMLLSLSDENVSDSDSFAEGSTVMQVLKPEEIEQLQSAGGDRDKTPYRPKPSNQGTGNSSQAAKAILEKYRRRPKS
jgi:predicted component of type VI protein secretion system